ncbi:MULTISPECIES: hypothetical protein [Anaerostipes]|uniref:50S ribosomal protein L20 n=1 Tax=Anaerostipes hominis (ex Lee et al. 2021) TaxID=2025494 RepID=A0ABV4DDZ6_9FIRM|nr:MULTISPECIES: hypothetical protein [Anaerostipes]
MKKTQGKRNLTGRKAHRLKAFQGHLAAGTLWSRAAERQDAC